MKIFLVRILAIPAIVVGAVGVIVGGAPSDPSPGQVYVEHYRRLLALPAGFAAIACAGAALWLVRRRYPASAALAFVGAALAAGSFVALL